MNIIEEIKIQAVAELIACIRTYGIQNTEKLMLSQPGHEATVLLLRGLQMHDILKWIKEWPIFEGVIGPTGPSGGCPENDERIVGSLPVNDGLIAIAPDTSLYLPE